MRFPYKNIFSQEFLFTVNSSDPAEKWKHNRASQTSSLFFKMEIRSPHKEDSEFQISIFRGNV